MIAANLDSSKRHGADQPLDAVLRQVHDVWIGETRRFLSPASVDKASFWERWTAVRYLADRFLGQYRRERALLDELRPFLAPGTMERLCRNGDRIEQVRLELDAFGRRRGTASNVAAASRTLLQLLRRWCSELERAASGVSMAVLPVEATRIITELRTFGQLHA